jgi:hypothetical protein
MEHDLLAQHDDHCRLRVSGQDWWIVGVDGEFVFLTNENGKTILDLSGVDWPAYTVHAVAMIFEAQP